MKTLIMLCATVLSLGLIAPVGATAFSVNQPDTCASIYPNANCLGMGPGNPYVGGSSAYARSPTPGLARYGYGPFAAVRVAPIESYAWYSGY